ncbi:UDP-N-acetylmuramoylalanine--D-glutamate ligase [Scopulibacillus daqui]|uniref:UDP-N-acetylmuramoylalanine--D-glutamate ligase n=1 Tax=Scopulibacillus daqui TaxID=1469162 RepID=A0ABS2PXF5_9BACL|nr:UDP-N-acetylmuramoyl-L-alanine--D-glutamate ligase [Scopulibacillus daqui]MBM7644265.1 UDP-N-acetylmuramoylalanine--D-glutamate ligase [Scopulibacillus daqui]
MKNIDQFKNKNVLVLGMAKSGYTAAKLLHLLGANVTVNDRSSLEGNEQAQELAAMGIRVVGGGHPEHLVSEEVFTVVKNPGIPYSNPLIEKAISLHIPIITEVELAYLISEAEFIGITGSNGKTTTTMLLGEMMKGSQYSPIVAGNIGTVLSEVAQSATSEQVIVAELSSFQLLGIDKFHPRVSVFLNLFEAHLDYHGSIDEYGQAKARLAKNQTADDVIVYNADDKRITALLKDAKAQKIPFSFSGNTKDGAYFDQGYIYYQGETILSQDEMAMPGLHNIENALSAVAAAKVYGVSNDYLRQVLMTFQGVRHRLEFVKELNGRRFYNDSKATNILATQKALNAFKDPVILLAGGLDRGNGFEDLIPSLTNVKAVVAFGETKGKINEAAKTAGVKHVEIVDNLEEAVPCAYQLSSAGDIILLSPACASWDQFATFEQRGDMFIKQVHMLK